MATGESPESCAADRSRSGHGDSTPSGTSDSPPKVARGVKAGRSEGGVNPLRTTAAPARTQARARSASSFRPNSSFESLVPLSVTHGSKPSFVGVHEVILSNSSQGEGISSEEGLGGPPARRQSTQYNLTLSLIHISEPTRPY